MNLNKKKMLAARTLNVGRERIFFLESRLDEIKEMITKQDARDLKKSGAIIIKDIKGRRKGGKRKKERSVGNVRKTIKQRKKTYMALTRKLRKCINESKKNGELKKEEILDIRKKIKNRFFKNQSHLKEYIKELTK